MDGRGIYKFSPTGHVYAHVTYYIGEVKQNMFHGLGRMVYRDGTQYFGSFNNNVMSSQRALIKYGNGDTYKGPVQGNMKSGEGSSYQYACGDMYEGQFKNDKKEGKGKLQEVAEHITYNGEFKDDRKNGQCTLWDFGPAFGKYSGSVNEREELDGNLGSFTFPAEFDLIYEGSFKDNLFHGHGRLIHTDSGNVYEGTFYQHLKDGPCTFTLSKQGLLYRGQFEFNYESASDKGDFGARV